MKWKVFIILLFFFLGQNYFKCKKKKKKVFISELYCFIDVKIVIMEGKRRIIHMTSNV